MPARAMWKGSLQVGRKRLPVKLYSAVEEHGVHFRLLDARSGEPVQQKLVDTQSQEVVPYDEVRRGFPIEGGFVLLDKQELEQLIAKPTRDIEIEGFLPADALGPEWLIQPYYLGPDGFSDEYFALAKVLESEGVIGLAHWVMRKHSYTGALRGQDGYLVLTTLHRASEVIEALPLTPERTPAEKEVRLAEQLIAAYEDVFDPNQYHDDYRERVERFVEQKAKGKKPRLAKPVAKRVPSDLTAALSKSLAAAKRMASRKERRVA